MVSTPLSNTTSVAATGVFNNVAESAFIVGNLKEIAIFFLFFYTELSSVLVNN
jgi:hypothetical protein